MNPQAPEIHGTIKLHKDNIPIRPIVNWKNSPGYKLAQLVTSTLSTTLQLPYAFNINNTLSLMQSLNNIEINSNTKLCSFDIANMYTNIPTTELTTIIKEILKTNYQISEGYKNELLSLTNCILELNYIQFNKQFYQQTNGLAMGAPTSAIFAEIYLQHIEHTIIYKILQNHNIIDYHRYVDDILIIYNTETTNIHNTLHEFNQIHPKLKFKLELETNNQINFLDITINKQVNKLTYNIHRKPTTTDTIIHNTSCHPTEHKIAAINYLMKLIKYKKKIPLGKYSIIMGTNNKQKIKHTRIT
jgi:hypothetical protein